MDPQAMNTPDLLPCPDGTFADPTVGCVQTPEALVNSNASLGSILVKMGNGLLSLIIIVATISLIYGALHWVTSAGNEEQVEKGKRILTWSVFGLVLGLLAKYGVGAVLEWF